MSEEEKDKKSQICEVFEPQAWRRTVCKNCFQPPEKHALVGGGTQEAVQDRRQEDIRNSISPEKRLSSGTDATSIKNKYERLEKDKFRSKQPPPKVMPKPMTAQDGSKHIPTSPVDNNMLMQSKFGSIENISTVGAKATMNVTQKQRVGSIENLSIQTKSEIVTIPIQRSKFGGSMESIASHQEDKSFMSRKTNMLSKLDAFSNEFKVAATSKVSTSTIIHTTADGKTEITSPSKAMRNPFLTIKETIPEPPAKTESHKGKEIKVVHITTQDSKVNTKSPSVEKDVKDTLFKKKPGVQTPTKDVPQPKFNKPELKKSTPGKENQPENKVNSLEKDTNTDFRKVDLRGGLKKANDSTADKTDPQKNETSKTFELPSLKSKPASSQEPLSQTIKGGKQESKQEPTKQVTNEQDKSVSITGNKFAKPELKSSKEPTSNKPDKTVETATVKAGGGKINQLGVKENKEKEDTKKPGSLASRSEKTDDKANDAPKGKTPLKSLHDKDPQKDSANKPTSLWSTIKANALGNKAKKDELEASKDKACTPDDSKPKPGRLGPQVLNKGETEPLKDKSVKPNEDKPKPGKLGQSMLKKDEDKSTPGKLGPQVPNKSVADTPKDKLVKPPGKLGQQDKNDDKANQISNKSGTDTPKDKTAKPTEDKSKQIGKLGQQVLNKDEPKNKIEFPKLKPKDDVKKLETKAAEETKPEGKSLPFKLNKVDNKKSDTKPTNLKTNSQDEETKPEGKGLPFKLNKVDNKKPDTKQNNQKNDLKEEETQPGAKASPFKLNKVDNKKSDTKLNNQKSDLKEETQPGAKVLPFKLNKVDNKIPDTKTDTHKLDLKGKSDKQDTKPEAPAEVKGNRPTSNSIKTDDKKGNEKTDLKSPSADEPKNKFERPALKSAKSDTKTEEKKPDTKTAVDDTVKNKFSKPALKSSKEITENSINQQKLDNKVSAANKTPDVRPTGAKEKPDLKQPTEKDPKDKTEAVEKDPKRKISPAAVKISMPGPVTDPKAGKQEDKNNLKNMLAGLKSRRSSDDKGINAPLANLKSPEKEKESAIGKDVEVSKNKFNLPALKSSKKDESVTTNKDAIKTVGPKETEKTVNKDTKKSVETKERASADTTSDTKKGKSVPQTKEQQESPSKKTNTPDNKSINKIVSADQELQMSEAVKGSSNNNEIKKEKDKITSPAKSPEKDKTASKAEDPVTENHSTKASQNENSEDGSLKTKDVKISEPATSASSSINDVTFDDISDGKEAAADGQSGLNGACAKGSARVHVDTQVFTSSRSKAAGVVGTLDTDQNASASTLDFSALGLTDSSLNQDSWKSAGNKQNGNVSRNIGLDSNKVDETDNVPRISEAELEKIQTELMLMTERCQNLETENENLKQGLNKKESDALELKKQKNEVESTVNGLRGQVKKMEERCSNLESDNSILSGDLKVQKELNQTGESEDKLTTKDKMMEDMLEENDTLRLEINDLKAEMEEMYDSFRDQEAEEFRELQKELEITAKNCRILQFKLRKMERRNEQVEHDRDLYEDKLRTLQNQFQDRDAVAHIHSLEDELRMAKEVSVRLHDELDLMEDKRSKLDDENRHITELLEQADRKQFRLEMEVDKLRDKVLQLKDEVRLAKGEPPRKVSLEVIGRQSSQEVEIQQLKRELYDSKERETDIRDQMSFLEENGKKLQRIVRDLEEENENLSTQLKKMSQERATGLSKDTGPGCEGPQNDTARTLSEVELRIQFELAEKELSVLKRKMADLVEENEMLHGEMFTLEQTLKEKDKQLQQIPEPSSPSVYYVDKIKEYEKEADEFRSKLLDKEQELERVYAQLHTYQNAAKHGHSLRKAKSLDLEDNYHVMVDLKRQLELSQQECIMLRERELRLEEELVTVKQERDEMDSSVTSQEVESSPGLTALAVAYVETDDTEIRAELERESAARRAISDEIERLVVKLVSLTKRYYPSITIEHILNIPKLQKRVFTVPRVQIDCADDERFNLSSNDSDIMSRSATESRDQHQQQQQQQQSETGNITSGKDFLCYPGTYRLSGTSDCDVQTIRVSGEEESLPRDPLVLLSVIHDLFCELVQVSAGAMASEDSEQVPFSSALPECDTCEFDYDNPDGGQVVMETLAGEQEGDNISDNSDEKINENMDVNVEVEADEQIEEISEEEMKEKEEMITDLDELSDQSEMSDKAEVRDSPEVLSSTEGRKGPGVNAYENVVISVQGPDDDLDSQLDKLRAKIVDLEEEVDDLRMIIHSKEQKNLLLEEEVQELDNHTKKIQEDSRKRETELFHEMDLIHGKNEILNNLLEFVKDRAEAAEDELERVIAEVNEAQASSVSSDKSSPASRRGSVGSDDVFDGSPVEKAPFATVWEEQFKKRIRSLERLLAEERNKVSSLEKKLEISGAEVISSALSDDFKLHHREKELLQAELQESERHAKMANDQIRSLTDKLKKVESEKWRSPKLARKEGGESTCQTCAELQSVKNELSEELVRFKTKAEELELKVEELNEVWMTKSADSDKERQVLDQRLKQKCLEFKRLEEQLNKLREEDRMKDIFLKERDNNLKDKSAQITRKDELIHEQEDIIRQREEDLQALFDQISQREKTMKEMEAEIKTRNERIKVKEDQIKQMQANIEEKNEELHYLEEEMQESNIKRKESETIIAEMQEKIGASLKGEKSELETENERLQTDVDSLMGNIAELHSDKVTLQSELEKAKQALSEAMLMWDRDRSTLGCELNKATERLRMYELTSKQKESQALQLMRKEVHGIIDSREKLAHELRISKMEHENAVRLLKTEKFKLTEDLTSKMRMLAHEISNNDKMSDELVKLRGQDDINFQLHHHEKILRAEYMAMKVRYETQLERLQREHINLLEVVEKLQREKNLGQDIIEGIQKGMSNIKATYTSDLSRWKEERNVLESHITQIEEGKEIAYQLKAQIDSLKQQLSDQEMERTSLVNKMTQERRAWDIEKAQLNSQINQLEEQLALFIQHQSKSKDVQVKMEIAWEKERDEQKRLLAEAHCLAMDLQDQLHKRDEEHARERKNLMEQLDKQRSESNKDKRGKEKLELEINTGGARVKYLEQQIEELKEKEKKDQDVWMKEKGELLRRLADMRKVHLKDVRRIDDVLASLKRLRELAAIVIESDHSATLPSNGSDGGATSSDASAASSSSTGGEGEMTDIKQNIDQVILKYVKESLRQLHLAVEELARPTEDGNREDRHKMRRSLSSSEIELLKDEFLLGSIDPGPVFKSHETSSGVPTTTSSGEQVSFQRSITSDGNGISTDRLPSDFIENILMEQSSFYNDSKDTKTEVHRIRHTKDVTKIETKVTTLPKPPPSFIIPRSRSTSPAPPHSRAKQPVIKTIPIDTSNAHRLSAPVLTGDHPRSSSADSSPMDPCPTSSSSRHNGLSLYSGGAIQSGSLDRLSPTTARKKFFEANTVSNLPYLSWPERKKQLTQERNSKSLSNSADFGLSSSSDVSGGPNPLRISVSMDDGAITSDPVDEPGESQPEIKQGASLDGLPVKHHSGLRDMFNTVKRKLKPKLKRSQSAREPSRLKPVIESERSVKADSDELSAKDEKHVVHERMTQIDIPDIDGGEKKDTLTEEKKRGRSRSPGGKRGGESRDSSVTPETTLQKIKKRFRSKSADRSRDHQVKPILVGHSSGSQTTDSGFQFSETKV